MTVKPKISKADFDELMAISQGIWSFDFYDTDDVKELYDEFSSGNRTRRNDFCAIGLFVEESQKGEGCCLLCGSVFRSDPPHGFVLIRPSIPDSSRTIAAGLCGVCIAWADVIPASKKAIAHSLGMNFRDLEVREAGHA